jgi:hypothetical protein
MNRRSFLAVAAASTGGVVASRVLAAAPARAGADVTISGSNSMAGYTIPAGTTLRFDPNKSTTLELTGNLINNGRLEMRPARPDVVHTLRFTGVVESKFVGGGMDPVPTDVGLWVMGDGVLDIQGTPRTAWNRTGTDATWQPGDQLVVTPTAPGDVGSNGFAAFNGTVPVGPAGHKGEVLNLTRNVVIEGTPSGRAHVFICSMAPQTVRYAHLRHLGPRKNDLTILGRWVLHFHHCMDGSRGSLVEGVVISDAGAHAFVPHMSHGVTFRNCIAYRVVESPFWWDRPEGDMDNASDDIMWESCVAASVDSDQNKFQVTGFSLQAGTRNVVRGCVAAGVLGSGGEASGFQWPSRMKDVWTFEDCVAHNNNGTGIFTWENDGRPHVLRRFTAYRNRKSGIRHGAYRNAFQYEDVSLLECGSYGMDLHARAKLGEDGRTQRFSRTTVKNSPIGLLVTGGLLSAMSPTVVEDWTFSGVTTPVEFVHKGDATGIYEFNRCTVDGRPLAGGDFKLTEVTPGSFITIDGKTLFGTGEPPTPEPEPTPDPEPTPEPEPTPTPEPPKPPRPPKERPDEPGRPRPPRPRP